ncbi:hypothetical protein CYMTET_35554, partial [Cymbomonas tetramitiformis]
PEIEKGIVKIQARMRGVLSRRKVNVMREDMPEELRQARNFSFAAVAISNKREGTMAPETMFAILSELQLKDTEKVGMTPKTDSLYEDEVTEGHRPPGIKKGQKEYYCLKTFKTPTHDFQCSKCGRKVTKGAVMSGCRTCNYDLCSHCKVPGQCQQGHELIQRKSEAGIFTCNVCQEDQPEGSKVLGCKVCNWDICAKCQVCLTLPLGPWRIHLSSRQALQGHQQGRGLCNDWPARLYVLAHLAVSQVVDGIQGAK